MATADNNPLPSFAPVSRSVLASLPFREALTQWLESRKPYIHPRTYKDYAAHIRMLTAFFGEQTLPTISADQVRAYQRMRMARAGGSLINRECSVLQQVLKRVRCWAEIQPDFQPLKTPKESPHRALTPAEEEKLYRIGCTNPKWEVAYCGFVIGINTTCGPGEIRHIRLMDIDPIQRTSRIQPEDAKNEGRMRVIPLNDRAWRAIDYLLKRAQRLGCTEPHHYLIPFCVSTGHYDPTQPAKSWREGLRAICAVAGVKVSAYSFRHHAITKLLENPDVSEETAEALAGHISHRIAIQPHSD